MPIAVDLKNASAFAKAALRSTLLTLCACMLSSCDAGTPKLDTATASANPASANPAASSAKPSAAPVAKRSAADDALIALPITGIDHLADHVSIQNFYVNGTSGQQAGKGGSRMCCVRVPRTWKPGLILTVRWGVLNWRDWESDVYETKVELEPYTDLGALYVHFLADGSVRAVATNEGPRSPTYIGPRNPIPQKEPWDAYEPPPGPTKRCTDHSLNPPAPCKRD